MSKFSDQYDSLFAGAQELAATNKVLRFVINGVPVKVDAKAAVKFKNFPPALAALINNALHAGESITIEGVGR